MKIKTIFTEDDAVSPVIGVILMVAITVILAAVIATFVLGLGQQVSQSAPRASFTFDYTNNDAENENPDSLTITHDGGDSINAARINFSISDATVTGPGEPVVDAKIYDGTTNPSLTGTGEAADHWDDLDSGDISAGDSVTLNGQNFWYEGDSGNYVADGTQNGLTANGGPEVLVLDATTVRVVWISQNGKDSATLAEWEGPDA